MMRVQKWKPRQLLPLPRPPLRSSAGRRAIGPAATPLARRYALPRARPLRVKRAVSLSNLSLAPQPVATRNATLFAQLRVRGKIAQVVKLYARNPNAKRNARRIANPSAKSLLASGIVILAPIAPSPFARSIAKLVMVL